jgi:hypothetical protein
VCLCFLLLNESGGTPAFTVKKKFESSTVHF